METKAFPLSPQQLLTGAAWQGSHKQWGPGGWGAAAEGECNLPGLEMEQKGPPCG